VQETEIALCQLVEARKDTPKILDFANKTLHQMPFPIAPCIVLARRFGIFVGWNDHFNAPGVQFINKIKSFAP
jgi:hypothetical protein